MPIVSKYDNARQEKLINDILDVLAKDEAPHDLALMTLGNVVSHVLQHHVPAQKRTIIAEQFGQILLQSVASKAS